MSSLADDFDGGPQLTWEQIFGGADWEFSDDEVKLGSGHASTNEIAMRPDTPLATDQQRIEADVAIEDENAAETFFVLLLARKSATLGDVTFYMGGLEFNTGDVVVYKVVSGSGSELDRQPSDLTVPVPLSVVHRIAFDVQGTSTTTLKVFVDDVEKLSVDDSSSPITGNTYVGASLDGGAGSYVRMDNWTADDITPPAGSSLLLVPPLRRLRPLLVR